MNMEDTADVAAYSDNKSADVQVKRYGTSLAAGLGAGVPSHEDREFISTTRRLVGDTKSRYPRLGVLS